MKLTHTQLLDRAVARLAAKWPGVDADQERAIMGEWDDFRLATYGLETEIEAEIEAETPRERASRTAVIHRLASYATHLSQRNRLRNER